MNQTEQNGNGSIEFIAGQWYATESVVQSAVTALSHSSQKLELQCIAYTETANKLHV
jgi:hypothetical protein